jgi:hypothetical protein
MKKPALLLVFMLVVLVSNAQFSYESEPTWQKQFRPKVENKTNERFVFDKQKMTFGGDITLQFGSETTLVNISPQVGYNFSSKFNAGIGLTYFYLKEADHKI